MCRSKHLQKPKAFFSWIYCYNLHDAKWHSLPKKRWPMGGASHLSSRFCVHCKLGIITSCLHTIQDHPNSRSCIHPLHQHTFFQSLCSKKKTPQLNHVMFSFPEKNYTTPQGGCNLQGRQALTNTACSATGCYGDLTRPFVKAPVDAKLRARSRAKAPVCMALTPMSRVWKTHGARGVMVS